MACEECKGTGVYNSPFSGEQPCSLGCVKPGPGVLMSATARFGGYQEPAAFAAFTTEDNELLNRLMPKHQRNDVDACRSVLAALRSNCPLGSMFTQVPVSEVNLDKTADIRNQTTAMRDPQYRHVPATLEEAALCVVEESTEKPSPAYAAMKKFVQQEMPTHWIQVASDPNFTPKFPDPIDQYDPTLWKRDERFDTFGEHMLPPVQPGFRHLADEFYIRGGNKSGKTAAGDEYGPLYQREDRIHRVGGKVPGVVYVPIDEARLDGEIKKILASKAGIVDRLVGHPSRQQNRAAFIETGKLAKRDWPLDKQEAVHALIHEKHSCIGHVFAVCRRDEDVNIPPGRLREPIADILWPDLATSREQFLRTGIFRDAWLKGDDYVSLGKVIEDLKVSCEPHGVYKTTHGEIGYVSTLSSLEPGHTFSSQQDRKAVADVMWPQSDYIPAMLRPNESLMSPRQLMEMNKQRLDSQHWTMQYAVNPDVRVQLNMPERDLEVERMFDDFKMKLELHYRSKKA